MNSDDVLKLARQVGKLKQLKRSGWVREGIQNPESVADHSYRTSVLVMILAPLLNVDQLKIVKMSLIHDVAESILGDIVVERGGVINTELLKKKEEKEKEVINRLFKDFEDDYTNLFKEFIDRKTRESKMLWQIDKLERTIQAAEYRKEQKKALEEFFEGAHKYITEPILKEILEKIKEQ